MHCGCSCSSDALATKTRNGKQRQIFLKLHFAALAELLLEQIDDEVDLLISYTLLVNVNMEDRCSCEIVFSGYSGSSCARKAYCDHE